MTTKFPLQFKKLFSSHTSIPVLCFVEWCGKVVVCFVVLLLGLPLLRCAVVLGAIVVVVLSPVGVVVMIVRRIKTHKQ